MKTQIIGVGMLLLATSLLVGGAHSQPQEPLPPPPLPPGPPLEGEDVKLRERVRMLRTWRLVDALDLTEEQSAQFFPLLKAFDERQETLRQQKKLLSEELNRVAEREDAEEEQLRKAMDDYREIETELFASRNRFCDDAAAVLSLRQQAKLLVFDERFQQRLRGIIHDIRHGSGGHHMRMGTD